MSSFKWTSPARRSGSTLLSPIPNEVYLEIFDYFEPSDEIDRSESKRILSKLALVCRFFCSLSLPRLFSVLYISPGSYAKADGPNYAPFCRAVVKGQEPAHSLSHYVKECTFSSWATDEEYSLTWSHKAFLGMYVNAVTRMSKIEKFSLLDMIIDKPMLRCIRSLQNLKSLEIRASYFAEDVHETDIQKLSPLRLSSLILDVDRDEAVSLFISLAETLNPHRLEALETNLGEVLREAVGQNEEIALGKLWLEAMTDSDLALLSNVAEKMQSLKDLTIHYPVTLPWKSNPFSCSRPSFRHLTRLSCPILLSPYLVPGLSLQKLRLTDPLVQMPSTLVFLRLDEIAHTLQSTVTSIKSLSLPSYVYFNATFSRHFPGLEELELFHEYRKGTEVVISEPRQELERIVKTVCEVFPNKSPLLQRLQFIFANTVARMPMWDLQDQHRILTNVLQPRFPILNYFSMSDIVQWRKDENSNWKPFIPAPRRSEARALLVNGVMDTDECRDYKGCYSAVLAPSA